MQDLVQRGKVEDMQDLVERGKVEEIQTKFLILLQKYLNRKSVKFH